MMELPDQIPPQSLEMEQSVLGSMLIEGQAIEAAQAILKPEDFYRDVNRVVYEAILTLVGRRENVDIFTLQEQLRSQGIFEQVGGQSFILQLFNSVGSAANVEYYAKAVSEKAELRRMIAHSMETLRMAYGDFEDIEEVRQKFHRSYQLATETNSIKEMVTIKDAVRELYEQLEKRSENDNHIIGMTTGSFGLDYFTAGLQKEDLIIIAARPGMGKSALAMDIGRHVAMTYSGVAVFSMEMSRMGLMERILSNHSGIPLTTIRSAKMSDDEWKRVGESCARLDTAGMVFDDSAFLTVQVIRRQLRRMQSKGPLKLAIFDYLQLMKTGAKRSANRAEEVAEIARDLKNIAKEFKIPVIALAQLSRECEKRPDKRPLLSDLRESGEIEAAADIVMMLYSDDYYRRAANKPENTEGYDILEIGFAKFRNGEGGRILKMDFTGHNMRFRDHEEKPPLEEYEAVVRTPYIEDSPRVKSVQPAPSGMIDTFMNGYKGD